MVYVRLLDKVVNIKPGMTSSVDITTSYALRRDADSDPGRDPQRKARLRGQGQGSPPYRAPAWPSRRPPRPATREEGAKPAEMEGVFVVTDGKAVFREIKTGIADQQSIEVITGLTKDEEIITGSFRMLRELKDGDPVKVDNDQHEKLGRQGA